MDRSRVDDTLTLQGDIYRALENAGDRGSGMISGANLLARWQRRSALSDIQLQAYFDQTESFAPFSGTAFVLHTWDIELQQALRSATRRSWYGGPARDCIATRSTTYRRSVSFPPAAT